MKRIIIVFLLLALCFTSASCNSSDNSDISNPNIFLNDGSYYAEGKYDLMMTPYIRIYVDVKMFLIRADQYSSSSVYGTYKIKNNQLIVTGQNDTLVFEIQDSANLILIDNGNVDYLKPLLGKKFIYSVE